VSDAILLATDVVNGLAAVLFLLLVGAVVFSMLRRAVDYRRAELPLPVLLKRSLAVFLALIVLGGESVGLRTLGITLPEGSLERLGFVAQADIILILALAYYAKAELFDLDDKEKP